MAEKLVLLQRFQKPNESEKQKCSKKAVTEQQEKDVFTEVGN